LVAAIRFKSFLHGGDVFRLAGEKEPLRSGLELPRVLTQALGRVVLRVYGDRDHANLGEVVAEFALNGRESAAHHGADSGARGEDKLQHHGPIVLQSRGKRDPGPIHTHQRYIRCVVLCDAARVACGSLGRVVSERNTEKHDCYSAEACVPELRWWLHRLNAYSFSRPLSK